MHPWIMISYPWGDSKLYMAQVGIHYIIVLVSDNLCIKVKPNLTQERFAKINISIGIIAGETCSNVSKMRSFKFLENLLV